MNDQVDLKNENVRTSCYSILKRRCGGLGFRNVSKRERERERERKGKEKIKNSGGPYVVGYYTFADAYELLAASRTFSYIKIYARKISRNILSLSNVLKSPKLEGTRRFSIEFRIFHVVPDDRR